MYTPEELAHLDRRVDEDLERTRSRRLPPVELQDLRLRYESQQKILEGLSRTGTEEEKAVGARLLPRIDEIFEELDRQQHERENEEILEEIAAMNLATFKRFVVHDEAAIRQATVDKAVEMTFEAVLEPLVDAMAYEEDPSVLVSMVQAIEAMGTRMQCGELLSYLGHEEPELRKAVITCVCTLDKRRLDSHVLPRLKDGDPTVQALACRLLAPTHSVQVEACIQELVSSQEAEGRLAAVDVLDLLEEGRAFEVLRQLVSDSDPAVSRAAIAALGDEADEGVLQAFLDMMLRDPRSERADLIIEKVGEVHSKLVGRSAELAQAILMARAHADAEARIEAEPLRADGEEEAEEAEEEEGGDESLVPRPPGGSLRAPAPGARDSQKDVVAKKYIRLCGTVVDGRTRKPLRNAAIRIAQTGYQMQSDRRGHFVFDRIERCKVYVFIIEVQGYPTKTHRCRTSGQQDQSITVRLHRGGGG